MQKFRQRILHYFQMLTTVRTYVHETRGPKITRGQPLLSKIRQQHQRQACTASDGTGTAHKIANVKPLIETHLGIVGRKTVRQIQDRPRMTTIHKDRAIDCG